MNRPAGWYDMPYEQQQEWEKAQRRCQREKEDLDDQVRQAQEDADSARRSAFRTIEAQRHDYSNLSSEYDTLAAERDHLQTVNKALVEALKYAMGCIRFKAPVREKLQAAIRLAEKEADQ